MNEAEYRTKVDAIIEAEYEALGGDAFRQRFGNEAVDKLLKAHLVRWMEVEIEHDEEFKRACCHAGAVRAVSAELEARRPQGTYREDGLLPIGNDKYVQMPMATREHLLAWALQEPDERNLTYIKSRLDQWDSHPECKTLAELEERQ